MIKSLLFVGQEVVNRRLQEYYQILMSTNSLSSGRNFISVPYNPGVDRDQFYESTTNDFAELLLEYSEPVEVIFTNGNIIDTESFSLRRTKILDSIFANKFNNELRLKIDKLSG